VALVSLVRQLHAWGFRLIDCQQSSPHILRFGAETIPRRHFIAQLAEAVRLPDRHGRWQLDRS
jgi:leucyl/phenylalanyl-tRNA--protein transferase